MRGNKRGVFRGLIECNFILFIFFKDGTRLTADYVFAWVCVGCNNRPAARFLQPGCSNTTTCSEGGKDNFRFPLWQQPAHIQQRRILLENLGIIKELSNVCAEYCWLPLLANAEMGVFSFLLSLSFFFLRQKPAEEFITSINAPITTLFLCYGSVTDYSPQCEKDLWCGDYQSIRSVFVEASCAHMYTTRFGSSLKSIFSKSFSPAWNLNLYSEQPRWPIR